MYSCAIKNSKNSSFQRWSDNTETVLKMCLTSICTKCRNRKNLPITFRCVTSISNCCGTSWSWTRQHTTIYICLTHWTTGLLLIGGHDSETRLPPNVTINEQSVYTHTTFLLLIQLNRQDAHVTATFCAQHTSPCFYSPHAHKLRTY